MTMATGMIIMPIPRMSPALEETPIRSNRAKLKNYTMKLKNLNTSTHQHYRTVLLSSVQNPKPETNIHKDIRLLVPPKKLYLCLRVISHISHNIQTSNTCFRKTNILLLLSCNLCKSISNQKSLLI